ncbi:hypothetical protein Aple_058500 [Acrocarpospora pleiomorpha]|uniref:Uncharacterized protein n=1 Tax=Acrocarpospora pleiomorpha TaxID=90975 RepID=A0A5M3XTZ3_9ACTN|nr:hypothetical protein Aple_058500 [Acrocarpospora pleiomorpha]
MPGIDPGQQGRRLIPIRQVARRDLDLDAVRDQLGPQFHRARSVQTTAAGQQQTPYPTLGHHMPREQRTQTTGPASDQHCAVRSPRTGTVLIEDIARISGACHPRQPRHPYAIFTYRYLRLARRRRGGQHSRQGRQRLPGHVDQCEPAWFLPLRGPHQSPHSGGRQVRHGFALARRDGTPGHEHQPGAETAVIGQPGTQQVQRRGGQLVNRRDHVAVLRGADRNGHHLWHRLQRRQVRCRSQGQLDRIEIDGGRPVGQRRPGQLEQRVPERVATTAKGSLVGRDRTQHQ